MIDRAIGWLSTEKHSTYGLAVTRMILGFIVASQLIVNWFDRSYTWGEGARWSDSVADAKSWPSFLGLYEQLGPVGFDLAYIATIVFAVLMMVGYRTRASSILTLLLWMSLYVANPFVGSGGDAVLRMVLLYLCFTDAGLRWSLDARLRSGRGEIRPLMPVWVTATLHNLAMILIIHQVVMVYVASAFWKLQSPVWRDGTAVYYPLQTDAYSPWNDWLQPIYAQGLVITSATYLAIVVQLFFPVLLIYRPTRFLALILITGMHLGIGIFMGILYFSLVMIAVDMILVSDASWTRAAEWVRDRRSQKQRESRSL
ncbi:HTTM domain-containing protein [Aeromicrobium sp. P5_D10]